MRALPASVLRERSQACCGRDRMSLKNQSADSLTLASNSNDTTGPGDVSNDGSVFAAGKTSSRLLADIRRMAPMIAARAAEIEAARRVPLDLVETLRSIGVFRMLAPKSHGGLELELWAAPKLMAGLSHVWRFAPRLSVRLVGLLGSAAGSVSSGPCCRGRRTTESTGTART